MLERARCTLSSLSRLKVSTVAVLALAACSSSPHGNGDGSALADLGVHDGSVLPADGALPPDGGTLADEYPGDVGLSGDPRVVWLEDFELASVTAILARYDDKKNPGGMTLVADKPARSGGASSLRLTAGGTNSATDFFKKLPDHDELFVRWYVKYQASVPWHHTGVWFGGYDPATLYPNPQAGLKPNGDDRFSIAIEPVYGIGSAAARFDTYDYWMQMHSYEDMPSGAGAYYGNGLIHRNDFTLDEGSWVCIEVHAVVNPDATSGAGAVLEVWKNDQLMRSFTDAGPLGYWIKDKFCPMGSDGSECTDYPAPANTVLDLQVRSTTSLHLNYFWPQNYVTDASTGDVQLDDMVVATSRVGCLR
ncbi:MAG: hypothetical protein ABI321_23885 [Polyangia bacterium]